MLVQCNVWHAHRTILHGPAGITHLLLQAASPALNRELHTDTILEHSSVIESRRASSAAASTSAPALEKAKGPQSARKVSSAVATAAEETSREAHTASLQAECAADSEEEVDRLLVGDPVGVSETDPAVQGIVDVIMARRCPNLNRFQNGSAYGVKVSERHVQPAAHN